MSFKFSSFWVLLSVFSSQALSQETNSLLWKIEAAHLSKPSYLYGTMHSHDKRAHQFGDSVLAKLNACDAVALEILTGSLDKNSFAMLGLMMMKDTTLDMLLSQEDYKLVKDYMAEHLTIFSALVNKMKPIFVSALLTEGAMRNDKPYTVDEFFEKKAGETNKKLIGIETVDEQMHALGQIKLEEQAKMLVEQIKSGDRDSLMFEQLMENYKNQDLNAMMKIYQSEEMPEMFDEALVTKRNHVMAHRMDSIIRMQPTFNAVGALHLAGDEGLVQLLRKKGYRVTPVVSTYSGKDEPEIYFPGEWVPFSSKQGRFTMNFPSVPLVDDNEKEKMTVTYRDSDTKTFFVAAYKDLSKAAIKNGNGEYHKGIEEMQQKIELIGKKEVVYEGMNAMEAEFELMIGINARYRFLLVKNRMYMLCVGGSSEFINSAEADKFFNSLKLN